MESPPPGGPQLLPESHMPGDVLTPSHDLRRATELSSGAMSASLALQKSRANAAAAAAAANLQHLRNGSITVSAKDQIAEQVNLSSVFG